jgi:5-methylthioadenosine/S-adenosylhomocysteine deaminase
MAFPPSLRGGLRTAFTVTKSEVVEVATLKMAISVRGDDDGPLTLGSLQTTAPSSISRGAIRGSPIREPFKRVVECSIGNDVEMVIVDGKIVG